MHDTAPTRDSMVPRTDTTTLIDLSISVTDLANKPHDLLVFITDLDRSIARLRDMLLEHGFDIDYTCRTITTTSHGLHYVEPF